MTAREEFRQGLKDGTAIFIGYFAVSFAFGIQAVRDGLSVFQAGLLSLTNLTSAGQLAGVEVIAAGGTYIEMAVLQFVINLRYLLMSMALSQKIKPELSTRHRLTMAYGITDEIFALCATREGILSPFYSYGVIFIATIGWVAGTCVGAVAGTLLPAILISSLGIALYGMFIAVVVPPSVKDKAIAAAVLIAMLASTVMTYAPVIRRLSSGIRIIIITVAVSSLCAVLWPVEEEAEHDT